MTCSMGGDQPLLVNASETVRGMMNSYHSNAQSGESLWQ